MMVDKLTAVPRRRLERAEMAFVRAQKVQRSVAVGEHDDRRVR
jgi:hypothetical protein